MGLFDFLSRSGKNKPAPAPARVSLEEYSGMRVEVLSPEHALYFLARLRVAGSAVELERVSESALSEPEEQTEDGEADEASEAAEEPKPLPVLLRGFEERTRLAVHMEGDMTHISGSLWRVTGLRVQGKDNDRAFFRQDVGTAGEVMLVGKPGASPDIQKCRVVNISAGGACVRTAERYELGDKLLLRSRLLPDSELKPLFCTVRRVTERKGGEVEYGCQFSGLDGALEDEIAKAILKLQMARMKR